MRILVVGGGGREHALCEKLRQSPKKPVLYCAPGNAGTDAIATNVDTPPTDVERLLRFARDESIDLTVVGPEAPLAAGIVDAFIAQGLRIFGPTAAAARLESDKAYAKKLMRDCGIPTAEARVFEPTEQERVYRRQPKVAQAEGFPPGLKRGFDMACTYISSREEGVVVKASGLAEGKGVFVHPDPKDALVTLERLMIHGELGEAGEQVLIEELLVGTEVTLTTLVRGRTIYVLEPARDYKRRNDGNTGPNTGGMGAYCPAAHLTDADLHTIQREILVPTLDGLLREGVDYQGVLYVGIMLTAGGPKVLEFNCRFGDPEAQVMLARLQTDLINVIDAVIDDRMDDLNLAWDPRHAVCVTIADNGYPGEAETGRVVNGLELAAAQTDVSIFHAGTRRQVDYVLTTGGRILGVTAMGNSKRKARDRAYAAADLIRIEGSRMRRDIAAD